MSLNSYKKTNQLIIFSANCMNTISPLAQCRICSDICPHQALTFQNGHWKAQNCSLCGLCTTICPTQVFQIDQMQLLRAKKGQSVHLCCYQDKTAPAEALRLNCLQQLAPLMIMHLLYSCPSVTLYLTPEHCQQCAQHWYTDGLLLQLKQFQIPRDKLKIVIQTEEPTTVPSVKENRRNFISGLLHRTEVQSQKVLLQTVESIAANFSFNEVTAEPAVFPARLPLFALYIKKQLPLQAQEILPFRMISCITCTFCGACSHICPTNALELLVNNQQTQLCFHPELCINCNLCQQICMQHGLQWEDFMTQQQFMHTPHIIAQSAAKICTECKEPYNEWPPTETAVCPHCLEFSV